MPPGVFNGRNSTNPYNIRGGQREVAATEGTAAADTETTTNNNQTKHTILTLSKAIAADAATIGIPAEVTFYDRLGITEEEVEQMKGELA